MIGDSVSTRERQDRSLGKRLRSLRLDRGLSLAEVATETGISASFLSVVETGKNDITVGRLMRLVNFYDVSIVELLPGLDVGDSRAVTRHDERVAITSRSEGIEIFVLTRDRHRKMMPVLIDYAAGAAPAEMSVHPGEEFLFVLEGTVEFALGFKDPVILEAGDSAYYDSGVPHQYANIDGRPAKLIVVITPPPL